MTLQQKSSEPTTKQNTSPTISAFIDWISVTHKSGFNQKHANLDLTYQNARGINGYTVGKRYTTGVLEYYNPAQPRMGVHIVYSGKVLAHIADDYGVSRDEVLQFHTTLGGRIARIDYAVDIKNHNLDLTSLWEQLESGQAITKSSHSRTQSGKNRGDTVYVGSRKSRKKLLRMYDKAKELGDFVSDYKRIELECRADVARNSTNVYQNSGYKANVISGMVRAFCDFPLSKVWTSILNAEPEKIPVGDKTTGNTEKWLLEQVSPALARTMIDNPEFFSVFIADVQRNYDYIKSSQNQ